MRTLLPVPSDEVDLAALYEWPEDGCVRVNFVSSLDGAAAIDGRSGGLSSPSDKEVFRHLRATCDVVLVGAGTARRESYRPAPVPIAVVTRELSVDREDRVFHGGEGTARPIVVTCLMSDSSRRASLEHAADVLVAGIDDVDLGKAVAALRERGLRRILCEGGPRLFGDLLAARLVDELCVTFTPLLAGGPSPRIADGAAVDPPLGLQLCSLVAGDAGELLARYARG